MKLIKGSDISKKVYNNLKNRIQKLKEKGKTPGLAVILVGDDPASETYVNSKERKCIELGIYSIKKNLDKDISQKELLDVIKDLNNDNSIHGILLQLPLPKHLSEKQCINEIDPKKDVDGLHSVNLGKIVINDQSGFIPCTPKGCQKMLIESGINTEGKNIVIVGRSVLVGKPLSLLLSSKGEGGDATVTMVHSKSKNIENITNKADILIVAIGIAKFIKKEHVKEGVIIIDVGINRIEDKGKSYLLGDVDFEEASQICEAITPVPGGVGVMTIAMLMENTVESCERIN